SVAPPAAVDLRRLALRVEGLSTPPAPRAQLDLKGQTGSGAVLALRGTVGPVGGPLEFDLAGDLRGVDAARTNPYVVHYLAWEAAQGSITARVEGRVSDDALDARVDVQLSRLEVIRAASSEATGAGAGEATGAGAGLPLNLIVALMRDSRGNINAS